MVCDVEYLCEFISERGETVSSDGLFLNAYSCRLMKIWESEIDFIISRPDLEVGRESKPQLILRGDSFFNGRRFIAEAEFRFKFHFF